MDVLYSTNETKITTIILTQQIIHLELCSQTQCVQIGALNRAGDDGGGTRKMLGAPDLRVSNDTQPG